MRRFVSSRTPHMAHLHGIEEVFAHAGQRIAAQKYRCAGGALVGRRKAVVFTVQLVESLAYQRQFIR